MLGENRNQIFVKLEFVQKNIVHISSPELACTLIKIMNFINLKISRNWAESWIKFFEFWESHSLCLASFFLSFFLLFPLKKKRYCPSYVPVHFPVQTLHFAACSEQYLLLATWGQHTPNENRRQSNKFGFHLATGPPLVHSHTCVVTRDAPPLSHVQSVTSTCMRADNDSYTRSWVTADAQSVRICICERETIH